MLCEKCKKKTASVYYNYTLNGMSRDINLCGDCADELIFNKGAGKNEDSLFSAFFGEYLGNNSSVQGFGSLGHKSSQTPFPEKICPFCGMSERELRKGGKLGCRECYSTFSDTVTEMLSRLHVSCEYKGKFPSGKEYGLTLEEKKEKLREEMHKAVEKQDYEEAAKLRDAIKMLEAESGGNAE